MKKSWIIGTFIFLALVVFIGMKGGNPTKEEKTVLEGPIVAFGDSLVFGYGATEGNDFVSVLSQRIGRPIINSGKVRDTTETALARLDRDVISHAPVVTIVLLGGNDVLRKVPKETVLYNLKEIVTRIREAGSEVVLVGVSNMVYAKEYRDIAIQTGSQYVPAVLDITFGNKALMSDTVHPNDIGYALFADRIEPVLRKVLGI